MTVTEHKQRVAVEGQIFWNGAYRCSRVGDSKNECILH